MLIIQKSKIVFLTALFILCIMVFAPASFADQRIDPDDCNFIIEGQTYTNETITFTDTSIPEEGYIKYYLWDFGDESEEDESADPTHIYTTPGNYTITHIIYEYRSTGRFMSTMSKTIEVLEPPSQMTETSGTDNSTPLINEEVTVPQDDPVSDTQNIEYGISPLEIIDLTISDILPNEIAATSEVASVTLPATLEGSSVQGISNEVDTQTQDTESVTLAGSYAQATI